MIREKVITGSNEDEIWQQLEQDLKDKLGITSSYHATLEQKKRRIVLDLDYDPGGGFENGNATTTFLSWLNSTSYRLAIHPHNFIDDIGKLFGMEDVIIGFPDFDKKFIIKTNNRKKTQNIFSEKNCRLILESISNFTLETIECQEAEGQIRKKLRWNIEEIIADTILLRRLYHLFFNIVNDIEDISDLQGQPIH